MSSAPVLQNRRTTVTFNDAKGQIIQPYVAYERHAGGIALTEHKDIKDCVLIPNVGWQMEPINDHRKSLYESKAGLVGQFVAAEVQTAAGVVEYKVQRQFVPPGVTYSADGGDGDAKAFQFRHAAGAFWDVATFAADLAAIPVPDEGEGDEEDIVPLDRVLITNELHSPDEPLYINFSMDAHSYQVHSSIGGIVFSGPAGKDAAGEGIGMYYLKLLGDGTAILYEADIATLSNPSATWILRGSFRYATALFNTATRIKIQSDARFNPTTSRFEGSKISFTGESRSDAQPHTAPETGGGGAAGMIGRGRIALLGSTASSGMAQAISKRRAVDWTYAVPCNDETSITPSTIRLDWRRNVRVSFQLAKAVYPTTATLRDDVFTLPFWTTTDGKITLEWYRFLPTGTAIDVKLFDAETDLELANPILTIDDQIGAQKTYDSPDKKRKFYAVATLTTSDTAKTATLTSIKVFRDALTENPVRTPLTAPLAPDELAQIDVTGVTISGATQDAASENAVVEMYDYTGALNILRGQSLQPVKIETEIDGVPNKITLFQGYVREARYTKMGHSRAQVYPDKTQGRYSVTMMGEWRRLVETLAPQRYIWRDTAAGGVPQKIDVVIDTLLKSAGYTASEIDLPGSELRLWGQGDSNYLMDVATPIADFIQEIVRDFYAGHLLWDPSAGTSGKWRVLPQKLAPYNILARFETDTPADVKTRVSGAHSDKILEHMSEGYGTAATTSPLGNAQDTVRTFIQRGTLVQWVEPPEGNVVYVMGMSSGLGCTDDDSKTPRLYDQLFVNTDSFNPFNLAPADPAYPDVTGPDYIGRAVPIHYPDPRLPSQDAVNFVARRIFDYSCHARKHLQFRAPLIIVTDADDAQQLRPRPLRYYDVVEVYNDETSTYDEYIVESVNIQYAHDREQMAMYHLVRSSIMATRAANSNSLANRLYYVNGQVVNRSKGKMWSSSGQWLAMFEQFHSSLSDIVQLPNPADVLPSGFDPPQNIDPTDPDYGKFAFIEGIDVFK